jgi:hypothetical protein
VFDSDFSLVFMTEIVLQFFLNISIGMAAICPQVLNALFCLLFLIYCSVKNVIYCKRLCLSALLQCLLMAYCP